MNQINQPKQHQELFIMSAMKRELANKIKQDLENKKEEKDLLLDQFKKGKIDLEAYMNGMNAIDGMHVMNGKIMNAKMNGELS